MSYPKNSPGDRQEDKSQGNQSALKSSSLGYLNLAIDRLWVILFNPLIPTAIGRKTARQHESKRIRANPIGFRLIRLLIHIFHGAYLFTLVAIWRRVPSGFPYFRPFSKIWLSGKG